MIGVIINEQDILNDALEGKFKYSEIGTTLNCLLKYHYLEYIRKEIKPNKLELKEKLLDFLKKNYKMYKRVNWEESITKKVNKFLTDVRRKNIKVKINQIDKIEITEEELKVISKLNDILIEKIAFILLVYAKISNLSMDIDITSDNYDEHSAWVMQSCTTICKEAKINVKGEDKIKLFNVLFNNKMISQRKNGSKTNIQVCYIHNDSEPKIVINDFNEVIHYYLIWKGEKWKRCEVCNKWIKQKGNKVKYCKICKREKELENNRYFMKKIRKNQNVDK